MDMTFFSIDPKLAEIADRVEGESEAAFARIRDMAA